MRHAPRTRPVALALGLLLIAAAARAGESTEALDTARQMVEEHQKTIAFFMHPTARLESIRYDGIRRFPDGEFRVDYTFSFTSALGNPFTSKLRFHCFGNGALDYCAAGETTAFVPPFTASNLAVNWLKRHFQRDDRLHQNRELMRLLDQGDARALLQWILKAKQ